MSRLDFIKTTSYDYSAKQGITFLFDIRLKDSSGALIDVTNYSADIIVYNDIDKSIIATISGSIDVDGTTGLIHFEHSAVETALLPLGRFNYYLNTTDGNAVVKRASEGYFEVNY